MDLRGLLKRRRVPREERGGWRHLPAFLIALAFVLPLYFMFSGSLRQAGLPPPRTPELLPSPLAWGNYDRVFDLVDNPRYTMFLITALIVYLQYRIVKKWRHAFVV